MAILVTGDTHGSDGMRFRPERFVSYERELGRSLNKDDYMIIAGDFGVIWDTGHKDLIRYEDRILDYFDALPWTTLFFRWQPRKFPQTFSFSRRGTLWRNCWRIAPQPVASKNTRACLHSRR